MADHEIPLSHRPRIAVTGGNGFLGGTILRQLGSSGLSVCASHLSDQPRWHVEDVDCRWVDVDPERPASVRRLVGGASAVVHCAGYRPRRAFRLREATARGVYRLRTLLDACIAEGVDRVVYISSPATLGISDGQPVDETCRYIPGSVDNAYFEAKACMEAEVYRYVAAGLDVVIAIPTTMVGPGDAGPTTGRWIGAVAGGRVPIAPEGITLNVVDVRDVAKGVMSALQRGRTGRRYILGGTNIELGHLVDTICDIAGQRRLDRRVSLSQFQTVARAGEYLAEAVDCPKLPPLLVSVEAMTYGGPIGSGRAESELQYRSRPLENTVDDTIRWLCRVGYLSWAAGSMIPRPRSSEGAGPR